MKTDIKCRFCGSEMEQGQGLTPALTTVFKCSCGGWLEIINHWIGNKTMWKWSITELKDE